MKEPRKVQRKGKQGKVRAIPGRRGAPVARCHAQREGTRAKRTRRAACKERAAVSPRDACGRCRRSERALIEKLKLRRKELKMIDGKFPLEWAFRQFAQWVREDLDLSKKGMAELCRLVRGTVQNVEKGKHSTTLAVVELYCWGAGVDYLALARILQRTIQQALQG